MNIINCENVRKQILDEVKTRTLSIPKYLSIAIIQVEGDDASEIYIKNKIKTCKEVAINVIPVKCSENITYAELKQIIQSYNERDDITGVMLQLPLPAHLSAFEQKLLDCIDWKKDIDGLSSESVGRLWANEPCIVPATPGGVMRLLPNDLSGKEVVIVNRSSLIGKPLVKLLLDRNSTVTICHSKTKDLANKTKNADIVIVGVGVLRMFDSSYVNYDKPQTWVDCGINRVGNGMISGDVDVCDIKDYNYTKVRERIDIKLSLTPVPGGVGVLTTAQLAANVIRAYDLQV